MPTSVAPMFRPVIVRMSFRRSGLVELNRISWFWSVVREQHAARLRRVVVGLVAVALTLRRRGAGGGEREDGGERHGAREELGTHGETSGEWGVNGPHFGALLTEGSSRGERLRAEPALGRDLVRVAVPRGSASRRASGRPRGRTALWRRITGGPVSRWRWRSPQLHQGHDRRVQVAAGGAQPVLVALRLLLVEHSIQDPGTDQRLQARREDVARDPEIPLHVAEAANAVEDSRRIRNVQRSPRISIARPIEQVTGRSSLYIVLNAIDAHPQKLTSSRATPTGSS